MPFLGDLLVAEEPVDVGDSRERRFRRVSSVFQSCAGDQAERFARGDFRRDGELNFLEVRPTHLGREEFVGARFVGIVRSVGDGQRDNDRMIAYSLS